MWEKKPQSYANHARFVPSYHFALSLLLVVIFGWSIWRLIRDFSVDGVIRLLVALAFMGLFWYCRIFPLAVQDRLIRLEMRLRLHEVLPEDLRGRIGELNLGQLIALRFAGDDELPALVREVLDQNITSRAEIKKKIKDWRADYCRC